MSLSVFDIASSRLALGRSSFFVMGGGDEREFVANGIVSVESGVNGPKAIVKARKSVAHDSQ